MAPCLRWWATIFPALRPLEPVGEAQKETVPNPNPSQINRPAVVVGRTRSQPPLLWLGRVGLTLATVNTTALTITLRSHALRNNVSNCYFYFLL